MFFDLRTPGCPLSHYLELLFRNKAMELSDLKRYTFINNSILRNTHKFIWDFLFLDLCPLCNNLFTHHRNTDTCHMKQSSLWTFSFPSIFLNASAQVNNMKSFTSLSASFWPTREMSFSIVAVILSFFLGGWREKEGWCLIVLVVLERGWVIYLCVCLVGGL